MKNFNKSQNKEGAFPVIIIVILAVFIFAVGFFGAFGFSFVKSKVMNKASNGLTALQKLGGGKLGNLPSGLTVKSKEEGIATCKKSGVDYCWPLVAVSFNDMSVCNQAPDKKACETEAKKVMQDFKDGKTDGGGTVDSGGGTPTISADDYKDLRECKKGTFYQSVSGRLFITGKETITLGGKKYDICCWGGSNNALSNETDVKNCTIIDPPEAGIVMFNKVDGRFVPIGATTEINGRQCTYTFTEDGQPDQTICQ